jgi:hypothetical protein
MGAHRMRGQIQALGHRGLRKAFDHACQDLALAAGERGERIGVEVGVGLWCEF